MTVICFKPDSTIAVALLATPYIVREVSATEAVITNVHVSASEKQVGSEQQNLR